MGRNLKYQFYNAINDKRNLCLGQSKHSMKAQGLDFGNRIYSYSERKNLIDMSANFSQWMRQNHPSVKMIKNIKHQYLQDFLNEKARKCSTKTMITYTSHMHKLINIVNVTYGLKLETNLHVPKGQEFNGRYGVMMSYDDIHLLLSDYLPRNAYVAIRLSYGFGCRVSELAKLHKDDIIIKNDGTLALRIIDSKGRRSRTATSWDTSSSFKDFCEALKEGPGHRVFNVKHESINQAIRRAMLKSGISQKYQKTSVHSIRKAYAQKVYDSYRKTHTMGDSLNYVSRMLGHGDNRQDITQAYISNIY